MCFWILHSYFRYILVYNMDNNNTAKNHVLIIHQWIFVSVQFPILIWQSNKYLLYQFACISCFTSDTLTFPRFSINITVPFSPYSFPVYRNILWFPIKYSWDVFISYCEFLHVPFEKRSSFALSKTVIILQKKNCIGLEFLSTDIDTI